MRGRMKGMEERIKEVEMEKEDIWSRGRVASERFWEEKAIRDSLEL